MVALAPMPSASVRIADIVKPCRTDGRMWDAASAIRPPDFKQLWQADEVVRVARVQRRARRFPRGFSPCANIF